MCCERIVCICIALCHIIRARNDVYQLSWVDMAKVITIELGYDKGLVVNIRGTHLTDFTCV